MFARGIARTIGEQYRMNIHRAGSIRKELELLGADVKTNASKGTIAFESSKTNFQSKKKDLEEIADYYSMKLTSLEKNRGVMIAKEKM